MSKRLRGWLMAGGGALALFLLGGQAVPAAAPSAASLAASAIGASATGAAQTAPAAQEAGDARNPPPQMPYVEYDVCPFECCLYRDWKASRSITTHERWRDPRRSDRPKVAFGIARGETVTAMTGLVMTTKPGRARVPGDGMLDVAWRRFIGRPLARVPIRAGDIVYLLVPHSEHTYTAWYDGAMLDEIVPVVASGPASGSASTSGGASASGGAAPGAASSANGASTPAAASSSAASSSTGGSDRPLEVLEQPTFEWWVRVRNDRGEIGWTDRAHDFSGADGCRTALPTRGFR